MDNKHNGNSVLSQIALTSFHPNNGVAQTFMPSRNFVLGTFDSPERAREAIRELKKTGYDSKSLSVLARGDRWAAVAGELRGTVLVWIPNFGRLAAAGPLARKLAAIVVAPAPDAGSNPLEMALTGVGLARESITTYEEQMKSDTYLLIVEGSEEEVKRAYAIILPEATKTDLWIL